MILNTSHGEHEIRIAAADFGTSLPPARTSGLSSAGLRVSEDDAYGLPAVSAVVRSAAETVASLSLLVYRSQGEGSERANDTWQYELLHERPCYDVDAFQFLYDIEVSLEASQNAFVQKIKLGREITELQVLDPQRLRVYRDDQGEIRFDYWHSPGQIEKGLTRGEILHIRGFTPRAGAIAGVSLIELHRDPLGAALAMHRFEGDFFRNWSVPPVVLKFGTNVLIDQAREWLDDWNSKHSNYGQKHEAAAIGQGGEIATLPVSLEDMLFVETKRLAIEDVARIFRWPKDMLELGGETGHTQPEEQRAIRLHRFYLLPRLKRIERALAADVDLFPVGSGLFAEFLADSLLRADTATRYEAYLRARQAGWMTANEIRARENYPPHPNGDELQATPVGGAPNPGLKAETNGHGDHHLIRK